MKLLLSPDRELLAYVESIQRILARNPRMPGDARRARQHEVATRLRALARDTGVEEDLGDLSKPVQSAFAVIASSERFGARVDELLKVATPLDDLSSLFYLYDLWDEVADFVSRISGDYGHGDTILYLATAAHESHNARTFVPPGRETNVILWYERLFDLVDEISFLLPLALRLDRVEQATASQFVEAAPVHLEAEIEGNALFAECLERFYRRHGLGDFSVRPLAMRDLPENVRLIAYDIEHSIKYFIIAHEIAHILENHEGRTAEWHLLDPGEDATPSDLQVTEISRNWDQELEADFVGFQIGRGVSIPLGVPPALYCWSVLLFFHANEWLLDGAQNGPPPADSPVERFRTHQTHPPLPARRRWIEEIIHEVVGNENSPAHATVDLHPVQALDRRVRQLLTLA